MSAPIDASFRSGGGYGGRVLLLAMTVCVLYLFPVEAQATAYAVNSPADVPDVNPGNNICETAAGNAVCTLRAAVQESNAHAGPDSITLQANVTYLLTRVGVEETALNGDLDILDSVSLTAAGPNSIIDGNGAVTLDRVIEVFKCLGNVVGAGGVCTIGDLTANISGITIQHGRSPFGGGILNGGTLTLANCTVTDNRADAVNSFGGGMYNFGPLTMDNCTISNNSTGAGNPSAGGIFNQGPLTITNSTIRGNTTPGTGGGIRNSANDTIIRGSTFSGNTAATGGGMYLNGSLAIINSTISGNFSTGNVVAFSPARARPRCSIRPSRSTWPTPTARARLRAGAFPMPGAALSPWSTASFH